MPRPTTLKPAPSSSPPATPLSTLPPPPPPQIPEHHLRTILQAQAYLQEYTVQDYVRNSAPGIQDLAVPDVIEWCDNDPDLFARQVRSLLLTSADKLTAPFLRVAVELCRWSPYLTNDPVCLGIALCRAAAQHFFLRTSSQRHPLDFLPEAA